MVPGLVIPQKFKVIAFEKYKGASFPKTHLRAYYHKMDAYDDDDKLLIYYF